MIVSLIVAQSTNRVIGVDGQLPWRLPDDLRRFRDITMGKPIIMGRATWDSIGRPLPGRMNIVMSRNAEFVAPGCDVANSVDDALRLAGDSPEVMVIGGGHVYRAFLAMAKRIYLTTVDVELAGDAYFPALDEREWVSVESESFPATELRPLAYSFAVLERR